MGAFCGPVMFILYTKGFPENLKDPDCWDRTHSRNKNKHFTVN